MDKINTLKNPTLWGRTYLYSPYKGVLPPGIKLCRTVLRHCMSSFEYEEFSCYASFLANATMFAVVGNFISQSKRFFSLIDFVSTNLVLLSV